MHLGRDDGAGQDTAADGDLTGERALLVCKPPMLDLITDLWVDAPSLQKTRRRRTTLTDVAALNGSLGGSESQPDIFEPSPTGLANLLALRGLRLVVEEDVRLLLVGTLGLDCQFGSHGCGWCSTGRVRGGKSCRLAMRCGLCCGRKPSANSIVEAWHKPRVLGCRLFCFSGVDSPILV